MNNLHIKLLSNLVAFKTVTPYGEDAIDYCSDFLKNLGFECQKLNFGNVSNLYAKFGNFDKNLCFAGHIDIVPPLDGWNSDPFKLTESNGMLYGRGTNDMKGPLSAAFAAISDFINSEIPKFSLSVILTSDEEIMGDNGTKKVIEFLQKKSEKIDGCVLCESCSPKESGEYIKIGCRGSLNIDFKSTGAQCHVVSGKVFGNHLHDFAEFLSKFSKTKLDDGNSNFSPSDIEMTSIDVENTVRNIIPHTATAKFNIRFNDHWTFEKLEKLVTDLLSKNIIAKFERFGHPFIGSDIGFIEFLSNSINKSVGTKPEIGTSGGNSDALSISQLTNVVEIGSPISGAHIVNEFISISDMEKLRKIYFDIIKNFQKYTVKEY